jgi:hypothetical protein
VHRDKIRTTQSGDSTATIPAGARDQQLDAPNICIPHSSRQLRTFTPNAAMYKYTVELTVRLAHPGLLSGHRGEDSLITARSPAVIWRAQRIPASVGYGARNVPICRGTRMPQLQAGLRCCPEHAASSGQARTSACFFQGGCEGFRHPRQSSSCRSQGRRPAAWAPWLRMLVTGCLCGTWWRAPAGRRGRWRG